MTIYRCTLCSHRFVVEDPKNANCPQCKIEGELHSNDMLTERVAERDREIASLRRQLASLRPSPPPGHGGSDNKNTPGDGSAGAKTDGASDRSDVGATHSSSSTGAGTLGPGVALGGSNPPPSSHLTLADAVPCGCGASDHAIYQPHLASMYVRCPGCGIRGPLSESVHGAITAWNRAMSRPPRGPLTEAESEIQAWKREADGYRSKFKSALSNYAALRGALGMDGTHSLEEVLALAAELRSRRDDPTVELRERYRDACEAEIEALRAWKVHPVDSIAVADARLSSAMGVTIAAKLALDAAKGDA